MKKILITSTDVMMALFLLPHLKHLSKKYQIDVACSSPKGFKKEKYFEYIKKIIPNNSKYFHVSAERSPLEVFKNFKAFFELRNIIQKGNYNLVWTNEPVMGVITRLAASNFRKKNTKVMYLAHGFHFFKGTPIINWMFYPIEKLMSNFCDLMVMINREDYFLTKKNFSTPVKHINGIGLNIKKIQDGRTDKKTKRKELKIKSNCVLLVSVGELMKHKNHECIIKALSLIKNPNITYIICGMGERLNFLKKLSSNLKLENQVKFLGYRSDVADILRISDIFIHPSKREGLGIASLEAMALGLPIITSNIHGIKDYSVSGVTGYSLNPNDVKGFAEAINKLTNNEKLRLKYGKNNISAVEKYSTENIIKDLENIITQLVM